MKVNSFLCCIPLEIFGLLIGWLTLILMTSYALLATWSLAEDLVNRRVILAFVPLVCMLIFSLFAYLSVELIRGVRNREPKRVSKFRFLILSYLILSVLILAEGVYERFANREDFENNTLFHTIMVAMASSLLVSYYFLICIDSLTAKLELTELPTCDPLLKEENAQKLRYHAVNTVELLRE